MSQNRVQVKDHTFQVLLSEKSIEDRIAALGEQLSKDYADKCPVVLAILNGSFMFAGSLMKQWKGDVDISFLKVASYHGMQSSGQVVELIGLEREIKGRPVVILEDIIDSGRTIEHLIKNLVKEEPLEIKVLTLLLKPNSLIANIPVDYVGFEIPDDFVIGYGMDYDGLGRNLPAIFKKI